MDLKKFFKLTKIKLMYLIFIGLTILVSGILGQDVIFCFQEPCEQKLSAIISQQIYPIVSFNYLYINTQFALGIKNLFQPMLGAGTTYLVISLIIGILIHYFIISVVIHLYSKFKKLG